MNPLIAHIDFDSAHYRPIIPVEVFSTVRNASKPYIAWIDSGATNSVFSKNVLEDLGFVRLSEEAIECDVPDGKISLFKYRIKVKIKGTDNSQFEEGIDAFVSNANFKGGHQILLGLDILSKATFSLDVLANNFTLIFR